LKSLKKRSASATKKQTLPREGFFILICIACGVWLAACNSDVSNTRENGSTPVSKTQRADTLRPTERFTGDDGLIFEHWGYQSFRLVTNGKNMSGRMNTERGLGTDRDATVYILNDDRPEAEQVLFARLTSGGIVRLNGNREIIQGASLKSELENKR
jgi:hypothetical protein